jgi:hypothetical protein
MVVAGGPRARSTSRQGLRRSKDAIVVVHGTDALSGGRHPVEGLRTPSD